MEPCNACGGAGAYVAVIGGHCATCGRVYTVAGLFAAMKAGPPLPCGHTGHILDTDLLHCERCDGQDAVPIPASPVLH